MRTIKKNANVFTVNVNTVDFSINTIDGNATFTIYTTQNAQFVVYFGDGSNSLVTVNTAALIKHKYAKSGVYGITVQGDVSKISGYIIQRIGVGSLGSVFSKMSNLEVIDFYASKINGGYDKIVSTKLTKLDITECGATVDFGRLVNSSESDIQRLSIRGNYFKTDCDITKALNPSLIDLMYDDKTKIVVADFTGKNLSALNVLHITLRNKESTIGKLDAGNMPNIQSFTLYQVPNNGRNDINLDAIDLSKIKTIDIYPPGLGNVNCPLSLNLTGKTINPDAAVMTFHNGAGSGVYGDVSSLFATPAKLAKLWLGGGSPSTKANLYGDLSNFRINRDFNSKAYSWYNNGIVYTSITGDISNLKLPYSGIHIRLDNNKLTGTNNFIRGIFNDRLLISSTQSTSVSVNGNNEAITGIYQQGSMGVYTGSIHDLTEAQITEIAVNWSTLELIWWLVNATINSTSTTKRYNYSITA